MKFLLSPNALIKVFAINIVGSLIATFLVLTGSPGYGGAIMATMAMMCAWIGKADNG